MKEEQHSHLSASQPASQPVNLAVMIVLLHCTVMIPGLKAGRRALSYCCLFVCKTNKVENRKEWDEKKGADDE